MTLRDAMETMRGRFYRRALSLGAIAAVVAIYLALIGIVERFDPRNVVTGYLTLGLLVPALVIGVLAYRAATAPTTWGWAASRTDAVAASLLAGLVGGTGVGAFVLFTGAVDVRGILSSVTPKMQSLLSLGQEQPIALAGLAGTGLVIGAAVAGLLFVPARIRRPLIAAMTSVLLLSLMEPFMRVLILQLEQPGIASFIYQAGGLTPVGASVVFVAALAIGLGNAYRGQAVRERLDALPGDQQRMVQIGAFGVGLFVLLALPFLIGSFLSEVVGTVGLYILMGLGLNIVVGYAGLLDLGYVAFFAIGTYATALLTSPVSALGVGMEFWMAIPIVVMIAAFAGLIIGAPVLRLRGDYLAIVTLGIGEIVRILLLSDALRPWLGGAQGILQIPPPHVFDIDFRRPSNLYYPILAFALIGGFVALSLARSRVGRAWNAMREDEDVAAATGVNITNYKLLAFAFGAVFGCIAGAFWAVKLGTAFPQRFDILVSITVLSLIILGGMGSIPGVVVGAFVLVGLPELLREFAEYRLLIYGAVLIGMMIWRPEGLIPSAQRQRELHEADEEEPPPQAAGLGPAAPPIQ